MMPVFADTDWADVIRLIRQAEHIVLITHQNPDGDGIGSQLALFHALEGLGKKVSMHNLDGVPRIYRFLAGAEKVGKGSWLSTHAGGDLIISLDCGSLRRLGMPDSFFAGASLVNIDHHRSNEGFGDVCCVDHRYCATGAMIYDLLLALGIPLNRDIAAPLYTAILTDTGSFRLSSCTADVYRLAANLVEAGADPWFICRHVYEGMSLASLRLLGACLETLELHDKGCSAWIIVTEAMYEQTGSDVEDTEGLIDYARSIDGVEIAVFIRADVIRKNCWKVSFRGKTYANVGDLAARLGGGGHPHAAGCLLHGSLDEVYERLRPAVSDALG